MDICPKSKSKLEIPLVRPISEIHKILGWYYPKWSKINGVNDPKKQMIRLIVLNNK